MFFFYAINLKVWKSHNFFIMSDLILMQIELGKIKLQEYDCMSTSECGCNSMASKV